MRARLSLPLSALLAALLAACGGAQDGGDTHTSSSANNGGAGGSGTLGSSSSGPGGAGTGGTAGTGGSASWGPCSVNGVPGECIEVSACTAMPDHSATPGFCPGPAEIQCCTEGPSVADNPPIPDGWKLMMQSEVTPEMTQWAVMILNDPTDYPMFSTAMMTFGTLLVMARVEWHPPDFNNNKVHRGVTLYEPA